MLTKLKRIFTFITITIIFSLLTSCSLLEPPINSNGLGNSQNPKQKNYRPSENMWRVLARSFHLPDETPEREAVRKQINWFASNPKYLQQMAEQAKPYLFYIYHQVLLRGLPAEVALLPMVESSYDPFAYSKAGAAGLWQMMPGTGSGFGLTVDWWYDGRRDIIASTKSALDYIFYLGNFFNNDWLLALAAYDTGEGTIENAVQHNLKNHISADFWHLKDLSFETKSYIPKLLALATIIKNPDEYPIKLPFIPNAPYAAQVNVGSQIDLERAAKIAGITTKELLILNPAFNRWATDPNGPHNLLLPIDKAEIFQERLSQIPKYARVTWLRYQIKEGDSLNKIAHRFKTNLKCLKEVNHLKNNTIRAGKTLLIPTETSQLPNLILNSEKKYFSSSHKIPEIHLTNYIVKKHDTLSSIAKLYHVTTKQIRFWNGLKSIKDIHTGQKLILWPPHKYIVYHPPLYTDYTVRTGDTLSGIAHKNHSSVKAIKTFNHMKSSFIKPKMILKIPKISLKSNQRHKQNLKKAKTSVSHSQAKRPTHHLKSKPSRRRHVSANTKHSVNNLKHVKQPKNSSKKHLTNINTHKQKIKQTSVSQHAANNANHAARPKSVKTILGWFFHHSNHTVPTRSKKPQQKIKYKRLIYHVKRGDNLIKIAKKLGVKTANLIRWNKIKDSKKLKPNQSLVFYYPQH